MNANTAFLTGIAIGAIGAWLLGATATALITHTLRHADTDGSSWGGIDDLGLDPDSPDPTDDTIALDLRALIERHKP